MKIKCIIKSILFSILILPLFQVYGQSLNDELNPPLLFPYIETNTLKINPRRTYFRVADDITYIYYTSGPNKGQIKQTLTPLPIVPHGSFRIGLEIKAEDILYLITKGEFNYQRNDLSKTSTDLVGLFLGSVRYLEPGDKSDKNISYKTLNPFNAMDFEADVKEDFFIPTTNCVKVEVPNQALWLSFSPNDSFFSDNVDEDNDYKVEAHKLHKGANIGYANPVQVIEAPQLERDENGLTHHYQSSYDLLADKPFMVRAGIHKLYQDMDLPNNTGALFKPVLKIEKEVNGVYVDIKNIEDLKNVSYTCKGKNSPESKNNCMFKGDDFNVFSAPETEQDGTKYYGEIGREFRLKEGLPKGSYKITVSLDFGSDVPCERFERDKKAEKLSEYFELEVHEIKSPRIGLARANCDQLDYIDSQGMLQECTVTDSVMDKWTTKYDATTKPDGNKEIDFFDRFFPVRENDKKFFRAELYIDRLLERDVKKINQSLITQSSNQNQQTLTDETSILLTFQTKDLAEHRLLFRYDYLVGVGSETFFTDQSQGLKLTKDDVGVAFTGLDAPFNKVAFVKEKAVNTGTLLHELGHLLGQYKEFYGFTNANGKYLPDDQQYLCTAHDLKLRELDGSFNETSLPCYQFPLPNQSKYTIYDFKNKQYVSKSKSIMGGSLDLNEQSMDRDTYISAFNHLKDLDKDPKITLISGIYAKGKMFNTQVNNHGAGMLHPLSDEGDLHIMLKDSSDQMLVETKMSSSFNYEVLKAGGGKHVSVSDLAPIVVAFPYQEKAVKAVIMKGEEIIFSKDLPIDNNPQHLFSSHNTHSTVTNFPMLEHTHKVDLLNRKAKKATSSSFTKFMYSPAFEMSFSYNACSKSLGSEDGIAILLGKDPADYTADKLKAGNQGVKFNNKGLSLHLNMNKRIQLRDGGGQVLDSRRYTVEMGCYDWKVLKLTIDENNKLTLKERDKILLSHDLTLDQIEEIASQPIGFNAYSKEKGLYGVRHVKITALPLEE